MYIAAVALLCLHCFEFRGLLLDPHTCVYGRVHICTHVLHTHIYARYAFASAWFAVLSMARLSLCCPALS